MSKSCLLLKIINNDVNDNKDANNDNVEVYDSLPDVDVYILEVGHPDCTATMYIPVLSDATDSHLPSGADVCVHIIPPITINVYYNLK
jgi:hypothetical protein